MDDVKVHFNSSQPAQFKANAFASGSEIHVAPGQERHLPHEAWHVVQQKQGRVLPTFQLKGKTPINDDSGLEREADVMGNKALSIPQNQNPTLVQRSVHSGVIQRNPIQGDAQSLQESIEYEKRLGVYAYNNNRAQGAADMMFFKIRNALLGQKNNNPNFYAELASFFGKNNDKSAGQVGQDTQALFEVITDGNHREKMTAIYNAMFGKLKQYLNQAMRARSWDELEAKGFDVEKLKRRKRQPRRDLYRAPGNVFDRKHLRGREFTGFKSRTAAPTDERRTNRTVEQLEDTGIGLSDREKSLQYGPRFDLLNDLDERRLEWEEGGTYWEANDRNKWVSNVKENLRMPVVAGPSGTMLRMFQLWEFLNRPVDAADWRLAILGWMLTSSDHSFHEMMLAAADYGLPYEPGLMAYQDVKPLSVKELRDNVAVNGLFPHEHAFARARAGGEELIKQGDKDYYPQKLAAIQDKSQKGALSYVQVTILKKYFNAHDKFNALRSGGVKAGIKKAKNRQDQNKRDELERIETSLPMMDNALDMLPDYQGTVYRGTAALLPGAFPMGTSFTFDHYGSTSLEFGVAKSYADMSNKPVKILMKLEVTSAKDVRKFSDPKLEQFVLPPGSKFEVVQRRNYRGYLFVTLRQTRRGGKDLKQL